MPGRPGGGLGVVTVSAGLTLGTDFVRASANGSLLLAPAKDSHIQLLPTGAGRAHVLGSVQQDGALKARCCMRTGAGGAE